MAGGYIEHAISAFDDAQFNRFRNVTDEDVVPHVAPSTMHSWRFPPSYRFQESWDHVLGMLARTINEGCTKGGHWDAILSAPDSQVVLGTKLPHPIRRVGVRLVIFMYWQLFRPPINFDTAEERDGLRLLRKCFKKTEGRVDH
jgi:hypothetical protein